MEFKRNWVNSNRLHNSSGVFVEEHLSQAHLFRNAMNTPNSFELLTERFRKCNFLWRYERSLTAQQSHKLMQDTLFTNRFINERLFDTACVQEILSGLNKLGPDQEKNTDYMAPIAHVIFNKLYDESARNNFVDAQINMWLKDPIHLLTEVLTPAGIMVGGVEGYDSAHNGRFTITVMKSGFNEGEWGALKLPAEATIHYSRLALNDGKSLPLYAVMGPIPELFGGSDVGTCGAFGKKSEDNISFFMNIRGVLKDDVTLDDKFPTSVRSDDAKYKHLMCELMKNTVQVEDQQYGIGFFIGTESETEQGVLDDIAERVLTYTTAFMGKEESMRTIAVIKLGIIHCVAENNVYGNRNPITGEEDGTIRNFFLKPATEWTRRRILYKEDSLIPEENSTFFLPSITLERNVKDVIEKIRAQYPTSTPAIQLYNNEVTLTTWNTLAYPNAHTTTTVTESDDGEINPENGKPLEVNEDVGEYITDSLTDDEKTPNVTDDEYNNTMDSLTENEKTTVVNEDGDEDDDKMEQFYTASVTPHVQQKKYMFHDQNTAQPISISNGLKVKLCTTPDSRTLLNDTAYNTGPKTKKPRNHKKEKDCQR